MSSCSDIQVDPIIDSSKQGEEGIYRPVQLGCRKGGGGGAGGGAGGGGGGGGKG